MSNNIKRILELEAQLKYHDYMYHELDKPVISDDQYETLSREYHHLLAETPEYQTEYRMGFTAPDPTMEVVEITEPMLSIIKKKDAEEFQKWAAVNTNNPVNEMKYDGMALRLVYVDGDLSRIHTRGNGKVGADLSHRRHLLRNVPDHIEEDEGKGRTEYTGEAYCLYSDFDQYVIRHDLDAKETDPRSTVSGLMKRHKATERDDLPIYFVVYHAGKSVRAEFETYLDLRDALTGKKFDVPLLLDGGMLREFLSLPTKPKMDYPIDGIVVKDNDLTKWDAEQGNQYFNYAACYKFPTVAFDTKVTGIDWSLALDGQLIGTLLYEPISYDGTTLTRAKLDYAQSYFDKGLAIGSVVKITKANEIIPKLVGLVSAGTGEKLKYPDRCPFCEEMVTLDQEAGTAFCNNDGCEGQLLRQLTRLTDRKYGLDIKGLGEKRIQILLDHGLLSQHADLFALTEKDLVSCDIDVNTAASIIEQINDLNRLDLHRWLSALGIPGLGLVRSIDISQMSAKNGLHDGLKFYDLKDLMLMITDPKFLSDLFGLDGLTIASYIRSNQEEITRFLSHYDFTRDRTPALEGVPIAITGSWPAMTRQMLVDALADAGFVLSDKVTKTAKMLLVGDKPAAAKLERARDWNINTVNITSLHDLHSLVSLVSK